MSRRGLLTMLAIFVVVFGLGGYLLGRRHDVSSTRQDVSASCRVQEVKLDAEQMSNAATISAVGLRRGVQSRAIVIALAVSMQESKLRNLQHLGRRNDHDSLGLFQQRPSQGWGSAEQILDQRYAADRFYTALLKVRGWEAMRLTDAAQRVQRSAYPDAYQKWSEDAEALAGAFTGQAAGVLTCEAHDRPGAPTVEHVENLLKRDFAKKAPNIAKQGQIIRVPVKDSTTAWQFAHWLVAQSPALGINSVTFADRQWSAKSGSWATASAPQVEVTAMIGAS